MASNYALFTFQLVAFLLMAYVMHHMYQQLRREQRRIDAATHEGQVRAGTGDLVAELRRAAEQINADISGRAATLEKLIDDANDTLRRLDAASSRAAQSESARKAASPSAPRAQAPRQLPRPEPTVDAPRRSGSPTTAPVSAHRPAAPRVPMPTERDLTQDAESWPGAPAGNPVVHRPPVTAGTSVAASAYRQSTGETRDGDKFNQVRRLSEQGMSAAEIARVTQLGREEVELIMRVSEARS